MFVLKVCKKLAAHKVDYALVGGYAVALHGAVRGTVDVDLILSLTEESFIQAEVALKKMGLVSRLPVNGKQVFAFRKEYITNKNLIAWSFYDPNNPAHQLDIIITENLDDMKKVKIKVRGVEVRVVDVDSLIEMKRRSGRQQDLEDVSALERLRSK